MVDSPAFRTSQELPTNYTFGESGLFIQLSGIISSVTTRESLGFTVLKSRIKIFSLSDLGEYNILLLLFLQ